MLGVVASCEVIFPRMDCDVIVSNLHLSIRTLVSKPVLEIIQNQHPSSDNAAMPAVKVTAI
eukprot:500217-Amphidinium_carterae.1